MTRVMISGHLDLTWVEFGLHYEPHIKIAAAEGCSFVIGNARGADSMSLDFLLSKLGVGPERITIFLHSRHPSASELQERKVKIRHGFRTAEERDAAMTDASDRDIAWVRSADEQKRLLGNKYDPMRITGTQKNLDRRIFQPLFRQIETNLINRGFDVFPHFPLFFNKPVPP